MSLEDILETSQNPFTLKLFSIAVVTMN